MLSEQSNLDHLIEHVKQYVETRVALAKLDTAAAMSATVSAIARVAIFTITIVVVILFASVGIALLIGQQLGNAAIGYLCVSGFFLLVGIILYMGHNRLIKLKVANEVLKRLANDK